MVTKEQKEKFSAKVADLVLDEEKITAFLIQFEELSMKVEQLEERAELTQGVMKHDNDQIWKQKQKINKLKNQRDILSNYVSGTLDTVEVKTEIIKSQEKEIEFLDNMASAAFDKVDEQQNRINHLEQHEHGDLRHDLKVMSDAFEAMGGREAFEKARALQKAEKEKQRPFVTRGEIDKAKRVQKKEAKQNVKFNKKLDVVVKQTFAMAGVTGEEYQEARKTLRDLTTIKNGSKELAVAARPLTTEEQERLSEAKKVVQKVSHAKMEFRKLTPDQRKQKLNAAISEQMEFERVQRSAERAAKWDAKGKAVLESAETAWDYASAGVKTANDLVGKPTLGALKETAFVQGVNARLAGKEIKAFGSKANNFLKNSILKHVMKEKTEEVKENSWGYVFARAKEQLSERAKERAEQKGVSFSEKLSAGLGKMKKVFGKHLEETREGRKTKKVEKNGPEL